MTRYIAKSPEGTVEFLLLPNRDRSGWQYVNLTDGHICPCKFTSREDAVKEFAKGAGDGRIVAYMQIGDVEVKR